MDQVNARDLRNHGGEVLDRVASGESLTVVRSGKAVAELRPAPNLGLSAAVLIEGRCNLPVIDPASLRRDVDAAVDASV